MKFFKIFAYDAVQLATETYLIFLFPFYWVNDISINDYN